MAAAATATASAVRISAVGAHRLSSRSLFNLHSFAPKQRRTLASFSKRGIQTCTALYKTADVITKVEGQPETLDYRVFFLDSSGKKVSPWHDIPLKLGDGVFNFVVEIPKESSAKMEVATEEPYTPIKQDTKKGNLRYYPYNISWNYGLLPQTWEDPSFANAEVEGAFGDNDPVDVVEIGDARAKIGDVLKVKPLGALAMIDEGELDWKIVAISLDDPKASLVNDVNDVEKHFPGTLTAIRDWFRDYKIPDGKPANKFGLGNKAANKGTSPQQKIGVFDRAGQGTCVYACWVPTYLQIFIHLNYLYKIEYGIEVIQSFVGNTQILILLCLLEVQLCVNEPS